MNLNRDTTGFAFGQDFFTTTAIYNYNQSLGSLNASITEEAEKVILQVANRTISVESLEGAIERLKNIKLEIGYLRQSFKEKIGELPESEDRSMQTIFYDTIRLTKASCNLNLQNYKAMLKLFEKPDSKE